MSGERAQSETRWRVWLVGLGDFLRAPSGNVRRFTSIEEAKLAAAEVGGIVQVEGAPLLGGFDQALSRAIGHGHGGNRQRSLRCTLPEQGGNGEQL